MMRQDVSFCIVGRFGSGKTVVADYLKRVFPNHQFARSSDMWSEIAGRKLTHYEAMIFQKEMIDKHGEEHYAKMFVDAIDSKRRKSPEAQFIIDGVRTKERLDAVKKYFGGSVVTIGVVADEEVRRKRSEGRDEKSGVFDDRERREEEQFVDLDEMIDGCDIKIINNYYEPELLYKEIEARLQKVV